MGQPLRVLIVEDSEDDAVLLLRKLRQGGYEPLHERVETAEDMAAALNSKTWDLILSDYRLPRFSGLEALALFGETGLDVPFLIVSGTIGEDTAVETMRAGAQDYIMKDSLQRLVPAIRRELKEVEERRLHRRTEAALVESEVHYRELVTRMSSAVAVYKANEDGTDFILTDFNPAAERIEKIKKEDLLGKSIRQVFPGVVEFGLFDVLKRVWKTGRPEYYPVSFYKDDRIEGWRENYVYMLSSGDVVAIYDDVTEKKKAEESVREAEAKYRHLFMNAQEGIYQTTPEGKLITVNPAMAEIYGYASPEEMIAAIVSVVRQLYKNPEDRKRFLQLINTHGEVKNLELEHLTKDGGTVWISTNAHPVYGQDGSLLCYEGTVIDVTERRRAEEELRSAFEKQRELAFIINHSPAIAWLWKAAAGWPVEYVSDSVAELGYVPGDFTSGRVAFASIIHPEDIARVGAEVEEFTKEGRNSFNQEYRIVTGAGDVCWIDDRTWIRRDADGKVTHYQGITIDITSRKRSEKILELRLKLMEYAASHSLEELLQAALDEIGALIDSPIGFYHFVEDDEKTLSLQAWSTRTLKEFCRAEGKGRHYGIDEAGVWVDGIRERRIVIHNDYATLPHRKGMPPGHAAVIRELSVPIFRDRRIVAILGIGNKPTDYTEEDVCNVSFLADVTWEIVQKKKAAELLLKNHEELAAAHAELKQAQVRVIRQEKMASIGQLAAGITHEINNPMSFITGNLGILRTYLEGIAEIIAAQEEIARNHAPPEAMEALEDLKKKMKIDYILKDVGHLLDQSLEGADRVRKIVSDLKTFSRIEEEVYLIEDINAALDSTINIVWNEIKYKAELVKEFKDLPPTRCNISHLNQVFMNLLVNAAQSIEQWGKVTVRTWTQEDNIYVSITDTGKGVPEENREKIFEPFFTTKPAGKGIGLGLSISHDIVKRHNGDITVESKVGEGTTFIVRIPVLGS